MILISTSGFIMDCWKTDTVLWFFLFLFQMDLDGTANDNTVSTGAKMITTIPRENVGSF